MTERLLAFPPNSFRSFSGCLDDQQFGNGARFQASRLSSMRTTWAPIVVAPNDDVGGRHKTLARSMNSSDSIKVVPPKIEMVRE